MDIPKKMKAVVAYAPHDYRLEEVDVPQINDDEVLIRVHACGICGSDIKCLHGAEAFWGDGSGPALVEAPVIPGHEFYGEVVAVGKNVEKEQNVHIGDMVTSEAIVPCTECRYCREGHHWMCMKNYCYGFKSSVNGAFAEYMKFPKNAHIFHLPKDIPMDKGILIEPFTDAMHGVERASITPEDFVVISGMGCIGLGMVGAAKMYKPKKIVGLEINPKRKELALKAGCDLVLDPTETDVVKAIQDMTDGYGCDVYIEAAAHPSSVIQGLKMIRKLGRFVEFSVFNEPVTVDWTVISDAKELDVLGGHMGPFCFDRVLKGFLDGSIVTEGVVTHSYPLEKFAEGFEMAQNTKEAIKIALIP